MFWEQFGVEGEMWAYEIGEFFRKEDVSSCLVFNLWYECVTQIKEYVMIDILEDL